MLRASAFVSEKSRAKSVQEERYYIVYAVTLFLCAALLFLIPITNQAIFVLTAGWMLLLVLTLALLRPLFYSRGVADVVMAILTSCLYALCGWVISGNSISAIEHYWIGISFALFLAGISRLLAYARMIVLVSLPLLAICGLAEIVSATMIFMGWPDGRAAIIYWFLGMTFMLSGFEGIAEAAKLRECS